MNVAAAKGPRAHAAACKTCALGRVDSAACVARRATLDKLDPVLPSALVP